MLTFCIVAFLMMLPFILLPRVVNSGVGQPGQTFRKPASWIKPQKQIRTDYGSEAEQRLFGESVKARQLQPLVCLTDGTLVCGYRRFHCGTLVGMTEFDVSIIPEQLTESEVKIYRLTENLQRKDLNAWEMYESCEELLRLNPTWSQTDLAAHLHYNPASITKYLSPAKCIPAWKDALKIGKVGITDIYPASKLPESEQASLLEFKMSGATRDQLAAKTKKKATTTSTLTVKISRARFAVGSTGVVVTVSGPDMNLLQYIESLQAALEAAKRANKDNLDISTAQRVWAAKAS